MNMFAAIISLGSLGCIAALLLAMAARRFAVTVDPRQVALLEVLAGANCGACGYPGCDAYARALLAGNAKPDLCRPGGAETLARIAAILGIEATPRQPQIAVVRCRGNRQMARAKYDYQGLQDCRAAQKLAFGPKLCPSGCLGLGSCVQHCPFGALSINSVGLAVVNRDRCTGCGLCVSICPRQVLTLAPAVAQTHVLCNSHDTAAKVKKYCDAGCLGCRLCVKAAPDSFIMDDALAVVRYGHEDPATMASAIDRCPHHCIETFAAGGETVAPAPATTKGTGS
ncbi:ion-translocating NADH:ferredoxin oxidoreductase complex Rnf, polyferredoxin membrane protein subunit RnfB [Syntrophotalea carbinolica DSM 2380]|uniref:Ion-translocating oxidoreductase complex subunit B n=2 Tax=Syntrophotalea carbinolica TaxID=19 RepID=Q3A7W7_SYNC1|nr:ion-translocating NADH:ferredoxin oxidoreductase complex Rnf, polyferredoxin membrane protein subunit RnfB [Syntrophotalea carbinolica DSM 2380]